MSAVRILAIAVLVVLAFAVGSDGYNSDYRAPNFVVEMGTMWFYNPLVDLALKGLLAALGVLSLVGVVLCNISSLDDERNQNGGLILAFVMMVWAALAFVL